ncbi:MAG: protein-L-isoaspartate(D-aspartate) O-methyltransferase [Gammaproteobacteria bacterium]|nr:protein-L-isoaspartate(D-aspartate) O-methyltransferase [Gammaproteobacteria bacterium]
MAGGLSVIATANQIAGIGMTSQRTRNRMCDRLEERGIEDQRVIDTMRSVPRHLFVDEAFATRAYEDDALPIGEGQTISAPWVVARMTEALLESGPVHRVLEVGTGSGYQAAVLSQLVDAVFTVERIQLLLDRARRRFAALQYRNIHSRYSDGSWGWGSNGPYDGIVVTAAPAKVPEPLLDQLAIGGRMVVPVGSQKQALTVITRTKTGFQTQEISAAKFVPFLPGKS